MMRTSISTWLINGQLEEIKRIGFPVALEIFPFWEEEALEPLLIQNERFLQTCTRSFHGPYAGIENWGKKGTQTYQWAFDQNKKTLEWMQRLGAEYFVFHHNNCHIKEDDRADAIKSAGENLLELNDLAHAMGLKVLVENAGVSSRNNVLLDQNDFLNFFSGMPNRALIDVGHMACNGWDFETVMQSLSTKIDAYHIHSNDGINDSHQPVQEGVSDFLQFANLYKKYTPNADIILEYNPSFIDADILRRGVDWVQAISG